MYLPSRVKIDFIKAAACLLKRSWMDCFLAWRPYWVWRSPQILSKLKSLPCWWTNISVVRNFTAHSLDLRWINLVALAKSVVLLRSKSFARANDKLVAVSVVQYLAFVGFFPFGISIFEKKEEANTVWQKASLLLKIKYFKNGKKDNESQRGFYALTQYESNPW